MHSFALPPLSHYDSIIERKPFGEVVKPPTPAEKNQEALQAQQEAAQAEREKQALAKKIDFVALNRTPQGTVAVGLIDRTQTPHRTLYLEVGEEAHGYKIIEADVAAETAVITHGGTTITLGLGKGLISSAEDESGSDSELPGNSELRTPNSELTSGSELRTSNSELTSGSELRTPNSELTSGSELRTPNSELPSPPSLRRPALSRGGFRDRKRAEHEAAARAEAERRAKAAKEEQERTQAAIDAAVSSAVEQTLQEVETRLSETEDDTVIYEEEAYQ